MSYDTEEPSTDEPVGRPVDAILNFVAIPGKNGPSVTVEINVVGDDTNAAVKVAKYIGANWQAIVAMALKFDAEIEKAGKGARGVVATDVVPRLVAADGKLLN